MNNTTEIPRTTTEILNTTTSDYYMSDLWIAYQIPSALLLALSAYLMIAVIASIARKSKPTNSTSSDALRNSQSTEGTAARTNAVPMSELNNSQTPQHTRSQVQVTTRTPKPKTLAQKRKYCMRILGKNINSILLTIAVVFTFLYSTISQIELAYGWRSEKACVITFQFTIIFYAFGIVAVYLTLWYRQHRLYSTKAIRHLTNSCLRAVSISMLSVTVISLITSVIVLNLSAIPFSKSSIGCLRENTNYPRWVRIAILPILGIIQQALLLALVIYPLKKHVNNPNGVVSGTHEQNIKSLIKRLAACTITCVASDILLIILLAVFGRGESSGIIGQLLTTANLIVNVFSLIFSFASWRDKLFLFGSCRKTKVEVVE